MSKYVPDLHKAARDMYEIEKRETLLTETKRDRLALVESSVRSIFEKGIIPTAKEKGYEVSVKLDHGYASWEEFTKETETLHNSWLKNRIENFAGEGFNPLYKGVVLINFDICKEGGKCVKGQFHLSSEDLLQLKIQLYPTVPNAEGWPKYISDRQGSGKYALVREISPKNLEKEIGEFLVGYENDIFPKHSEQLTERENIQSKLA